MKWITSLVFITLSLCGYESISNEKLALLAPKSAIIDIRTPSEWKETGVIKGSHLITFFQDNGSYDARGFLMQLEQRKLTQKPLIIICRSGNRSVPVSDFLSRQGFKEVYNVQRGLVGWLEAGKGVVKVQ